MCPFLHYGDKRILPTQVRQGTLSNYILYHEHKCHVRPLHAVFSSEVHLLHVLQEQRKKQKSPPPHILACK